MPAYGGAGLGAILPALGTRACPLPSIWLTATGDFPESQRWPEENLISKLEAQVSFLESQSVGVDLFIGYLANVDQALALNDWLSKHRQRLGTVWIDPISGDNGKAYVSKELIQAWSVMLHHADILIPNTTEIALLAEAQGLSREAWIEQYVESGHVIETSASGQDDSHGICLHSAKDCKFIEVVWEPGRYRGTGDLFASHLIASVGSGWAVEAAIKRSAELVRKTIRNTREAGTSSLVLP